MDARPLARDAWLNRWRVELDAQLRFARLAERLSRAGAPPSVVEGAQLASRDEGVHAAHCQRITHELGHDGPAPAAALSEVAPAGLSPSQSLLYEVVAACCVTETESVAVLTELLAEMPAGPVREVIKELAEDEVRHSRLGWTWLALRAGVDHPGFLAPFLPVMLEAVGGPGFFDPPGEEPDHADLVAMGVLPRRRHQRLMRSTAEEVILPGLASFGVDTAAAQRWLSPRG